jgi:7-cyano-7-deazaguanine synthase
LNTKIRFIAVEVLAPLFKKTKMKQYFSWGTVFSCVGRSFYMLKDEKAVVVFSGGQDSTTCLFWALETFKEVEVVTFNYNQRHKQEIECAKAIASEVNVTHHILDMQLLNQLAPNALTRNDMEIKEGEDGELPSTFVPGRNLLFLSFAAVLASQVGAKHIITGVSETDFSGYPDCRDSFIKSLNVTINLAMDQQFVIHTPLMWLDKAQTWKLSDDLGVLDFVREKTLTCYEGVIGDGCGECPACKLRKNGLTFYLESRERFEEFK